MWNQCHAQRYAYDGTGNDAIEERSSYLFGHEHTAKYNAYHSKDGGRGKFAKCNESSWVGYDNTCIFKANEGYKHSYTSRNSITQILRNTIEYHFSDVEEGNQNKD